MPGRAYIGLSSDKKHPGQFRPQRLADAPSISLGRIITGIVAALVVLGFGYSLHTPDGRVTDCVGDMGDRTGCPPQLGAGVPMVVWLSVAVLVATLVIGWPYLRYAMRRRSRDA
jgi:hypothetical protein